MTRFTILLAVLFLWCTAFAQNKKVNVKIHIRGVAVTDISLIPLTGSHAFRPVLTSNGVAQDDSISFSIPPEYLPGEFMLRFDYKENLTASSYPSEKYIIANNQDLEFFTNPVFVNDPDSSYFSENEIENTAWQKFTKENKERLEGINVLYSFLTNYDDTRSGLYEMARREYKSRRDSYHAWIKAQAKEKSALFMAAKIPFNLLPLIEFSGSKDTRLKSMIAHYFDDFDFTDPSVVKVMDMETFLTQYVNLHGQIAYTLSLRDSLFVSAGKNAIELAKMGNPVVYGWMVDYFYKGYESNHIDPGFAMLKPYLDDPECLTSKRREIQKRLDGIQRIQPGQLAPNIILTDREGKVFNLYEDGAHFEKLLVVFWSASCPHCTELMDELYQWYASNAGKIHVVPVSVDETDDEISTWQQRSNQFPLWNHYRSPGGINGTEGVNYSLLSTPLMILIDGPTHQILHLPDTVAELNSLL